MLPANLSHSRLKKLLAVTLLSDGYLRMVKGKPACLRLATVPDSIEQHRLFAELCEGCFHKSPRTYLENAEQKPLFASVLYSRSAAREMLQLTPAYKTTPNNKETPKEFLEKAQPTLSFLENEPRWFKWLAFRIFLDFDGSISPIFKLKHKKDKKCKRTYIYYQVQFECEARIAETNPTLVESLLGLARDLGLRARIGKDARNWSGLGGIVISEKRSVKKVIEQGPMTNVAIHKGDRFRGIAKQSICEAVASFLQKSGGRCSWHFNNKLEASALKSFLNAQFNKILNSPIV